MQSWYRVWQAQPQPWRAAARKHAMEDLWKNYMIDHGHGGLDRMGQESMGSLNARCERKEQLGDP